MDEEDVQDSGGEDGDEGYCCICGERVESPNYLECGRCPQCL